MTRIKYPCYADGCDSQRDFNPSPCERKAKRGDMWACPHLLAGGTWETCEAGGLREADKAKPPMGIPAVEAGVKEG